MRPWLAGLCLTAFAAATPAQQHNVLLIIADDMGIDLVNAYGVSPLPAHTPVIDTLAAGGLLFRNAWANPVCSPTRAQILTGRQGFRTGLGKAISYFVEDWELQLDETSLAQVLAPVYRTAAIGKWHLSVASGTGSIHPLLMGFEHHAGTLSVIPGNYIGDDYYHYEKSVDGTTQMSYVYATTDTVNDCLAQIQAFNQPWFIWLAFNAPHAPFHKPPPKLHTYTLPPTLDNSTVPIHVRAMTEAMDTEIGRLLATMDAGVLANTVIIFVGDNGTDKLAVVPPFDKNKAKGSVYEGGVRVPLIIRGPGVPSGAECDGLVCATDLFATIADIAGQPHPTGTDSVSLLPYFSDPGQRSLRPYAYAEFFTPNGIVGKGEWLRAARDLRYKLMWTLDTDVAPAPTLALFDLQADPFETVNLLPGPLTPDQQQAFAALQEQIALAYVPWLKDSAGLAGVDGVPALSGNGALDPGAVVSLTLTSARPSAPAMLFIGNSWLHALFKGGFVGPDPDIVVAPLLTSPTGNITILGHWPAALPAGLSLYYQYWIADPAGPKGFSASNNVASVTPY
jgi:arylsulfatase A-like enzyme